MHCVQICVFICPATLSFLTGSCKSLDKLPASLAPIEMDEHEQLKLTQVIAAGMVAQGKSNLRELFGPILHFTRWQQAPVASLMLQFLPFMTLLIEA